MGAEAASDVVVSATFTTTPKSVMASYRACHRAGYVLRIVITALLVLEGIVLFEPVVAVAGLLLYAGFEWLVRRQLRPYLLGERVVILTMTEDDYIVEGVDHRSSRRWSTFASVRPTGQFWVLRLNFALAMAFPLSALDGEQTKAFEALLRRKGLRPTATNLCG